MSRPKLGLNGFGRIGRAIYKINRELGLFDIVEVNDIVPDLCNMLYLLRHDSVYGRFDGEVSLLSPDSFSVDGQTVQYHSHSTLDAVPWNSELDVVVDASAVEENVLCSRNLLSERPKLSVVVTHCSSGVDRTIVAGANDAALQSNDRLVSSSICDANAVAQVLKVVMDNWGLEMGTFTTLHPWLSYQNLVDGPLGSIASPGHTWNDYALGRSSPDALIPKNTTAGGAVVEVLPELSGRLSSFSYRVPTQVVASADMTLVTTKPVTVPEVHDVFQWVASESSTFGYNVESLVSKDYERRTESAILDAQWVQVGPGNMLKLIAWYDNEWGYAARALDLAARLAQR